MAFCFLFSFHKPGIWKGLSVIFRLHMHYEDSALIYLLLEKPQSPNGTSRIHGRGDLKIKAETGKQQKSSDMKGQAEVNTIVDCHKQNDFTLRENVAKY
jgi:hypothetical protein